MAFFTGFGPRRAADLAEQPIFFLQSSSQSVQVSALNSLSLLLFACVVIESSFAASFHIEKSLRKLSFSSLCSLYIFFSPNFHIFDNLSRETIQVGLAPPVRLLSL